MDLNFDAIQGLLEKMPKDGSAAEYVSWFASMLKAFFELVSGLFKSFTDKAKADETTNPPA